MCMCILDQLIVNLAPPAFLLLKLHPINTTDLASGVIRIYDIDMDVSNSNRQSMFGGPMKQIGKFETTTTYTNKKISETGRATTCHDGYKKNSTTSKHLLTLRTISMKCQQLSEPGTPFR